MTFLTGPGRFFNHAPQSKATIALQALTLNKTHPAQGVVRLKGFTNSFEEGLELCWEYFKLKKNESLEHVFAAWDVRCEHCVAEGEAS